MFRSKKSIFDKINDYLIKKGHELVMSIYLNNYNGNNIYIRVDYLRKLSIYKVVWVDLNFLNPKKLDAYINSQMVTKYIAVKLIEQLNRIKMDSGYVFNDKVVGDRVEIVTYFKDSPKEYVFDRFLPLEWEPFIDLFAIVFSYLPRGMEIFLHEIFAKFDGRFVDEWPVHQRAIFYRIPEVKIKDRGVEWTADSLEADIAKTAENETKNSLPIGNFKPEDVDTTLAGVYDKDYFSGMTDVDAFLKSDL
jgi:hypothetical protein